MACTTPSLHGLPKHYKFTSFIFQVKVFVFSVPISTAVLLLYVNVCKMCINPFYIYCVYIYMLCCINERDLFSMLCLV